MWKSSPLTYVGQGDAVDDLARKHLEVTLWQPSYADGGALLKWYMLHSND